jgi:hypothetical protein
MVTHREIRKLEKQIERLKKENARLRARLEAISCGKRTGQKYGDNHHRTLIPTEDARMIANKTDWALGEQTALARKYGVSTAAIWKIKTGKRAL